MHASRLVREGPCILLAVGLVFACAGPLASAATLLVPQQYPTIKEALLASQNGDTVLIAPGVYALANGDFNGGTGKSIKVQGSGQGETRLDLPVAVSVYLAGPVSGPPLVITELTLQPALAGQSGGTFSVDGNVQVLKCTFQSLRSAAFRALQGTATLVQACSFEGEWELERPQVTAHAGGSIVVESCVFSIMSLGGSSQASALQVENSVADPDAVVIRDSAFVCNSGLNWGAVVGHPSRIEGCIFVHNSASGLGGAAVLTGVGGVIAPTIVTGCHFYDNSAPVGGAIVSWLGALVDVSNCEFANNTADYAGAIYSAGPLLVNDTSFCGNAGGDILAGGTYGSGNTFDAECGKDCDQDGVPDSSAIALGLAEDIDGDGVPDVCQPQYFSGDLNGDCVVNGADLGIVIAGWGSNTGAGDVNQDGSVDGSDLAVVLGQWSG